MTKRHRQSFLKNWIQMQKPNKPIVYSHGLLSSLSGTHGLYFSSGIWFHYHHHANNLSPRVSVSASALHSWPLPLPPFLSPFSSSPFSHSPNHLPSESPTFLASSKSKTARELHRPCKLLPPTAFSTGFFLLTPPALSLA